MTTYRWLRTFASPEPHEAVLAYLRGRTAGAFDVVEKHLQAQAFMVSDRLTIADLSMAGYLFYPKEELGFDLATDYPGIAAWMSRLAQIPGWRAPYELLG